MNIKSFRKNQMSIITNFMDIFLHLDKHLSLYMNDNFILIYFIKFAIIFYEAGLVVTPFLPGDSLVFATGALVASGSIRFAPVYPILCIAAIAGDTANYSIGHF